MLDGDNIVLEALAQPPMELLDAFRKHKPDLVALLRSDVSDPSQEPPTQFPAVSPKPEAPPNLVAAPTEFLKEVKRSGAKLFPVGGRLELRGEGDPKLQAEFQRHRP